MSSSIYAPANDEEEMDGLDSHFYSGNTFYTDTVQNILTLQNSEIKTNTEAVIQPLYQVSRKRLRELIQKHNADLFKFMEQTPTAIGIADALFKKFGQEPPALNRSMIPISRELALDTSMNTVLAELDAAMNKEIGVSGSIQNLGRQMKWLFNQYKTTGEEVMRLEAYLTQKTQNLDKHHQRLNTMLTLKNNSALPGLLDAFHAYSTEIFKESAIETTYRELVEIYKKWNILREFISLQSVTDMSMKEPMCAICLTDPITHAVVPCGHTFCTGCVRRLNISCYLCRGPVRERVKLFFT
jgi:hypothetical protein